MEIKVTNCNDCPFGQMDWDMDYGSFVLRCSLAEEGTDSIKHFGRIDNINKRKFKPPADCKLIEAKEIIVNFEYGTTR